MINKKSIIILLCVLAVLVGAFFAVTYLWNEEEAPENDNKIQSIELFTTSKDNIVEMSLKVKGEDFTFVRSEDKWVLKGKEDVKLKQSAVDYLCIDLAAIYAQKCVEENADADDISAYGLKEPTGTYNLKLADGSTKTFYLGDKNPVTSTYYFKMADTDDVYTIYSNKGDSLSKGSAQYKDSYILNIDSENLSRIYMHSGGEVLELKKTVTGEGEQMTTVWDMLQPMKRECDIQPISENIISKLSYITVEDFIDEADERYTKSGVNNPSATVTLTDDDGISQTIYIGKSDGTSRYIKTNNRVYLIPSDSVSFIDIDPFIYISKFINLESIDEVAKAEITHAGKTHVVTIEGEKDKYIYKLNGKEVMEDTFKRQVYQKIIGILADGFAQNPRYSTPEYTITYYMRDGAFKTTNYCAYDDRSYAAYDKNGRCVFIVRKKKLDEVFASLENVASGKSKE